MNGVFAMCGRCDRTIMSPLSKVASTLLFNDNLFPIDDVESSLRGLATELTTVEGEPG